MRRWFFRRLYELLDWAGDQLLDVRATVMDWRSSAYRKAFPAGADLKYHFGRVKVTGSSLAGTSGPGSFLRTLEAEMAQLRADALADQARMARGRYGD